MKSFWFLLLFFSVFVWEPAFKSVGAQDEDDYEDFDYEDEDKDPTKPTISIS